MFLRFPPSRRLRPVPPYRLSPSHKSEKRTAREKDDVSVPRALRGALTLIFFADVFRLARWTRRKGETARSLSQSLMILI